MSLWSQKGYAQRVLVVNMTTGWTIGTVEVTASGALCVTKAHLMQVSEEWPVLWQTQVVMVIGIEKNTRVTIYDEIGKRTGALTYREDRHWEIPPNWINRTRQYDLPSPARDVFSQHGHRTDRRGADSSDDEGGSSSLARMRRAREEQRLERENQEKERERLAAVETQRQEHERQEKVRERLTERRRQEHEAKKMNVNDRLNRRQRSNSVMRPSNALKRRSANELG